MVMDEKEIVKELKRFTRTYGVGEDFITYSTTLRNRLVAEGWVIERQLTDRGKYILQRI